jgi:hypothetical protein
MSATENDALKVSTNEAETQDLSGLSRRKFLGGLGGAAAATMAAGVVGLEPLVDAAATTEANNSTSAGVARRNRAWQVRKDSADFWKAQPVATHPTNGDEERYPNRIGNYSKGLPHNSFGEVDQAAYNSMLAACISGNPDDFNNIIVAPGAKMTSPQAGLAFDMEGADIQALAVPAPPALASREQAAEIIEHYWMALLRDVNYLDYDSSPLVAQAAADLNAFGADYKSPKVGGVVTPQTLFRDIGPGMAVGPYISQFFWLPTPFGVEYVERKMWTKTPGVDHLQTWSNYLAAQNGQIVEAPSFLGSRKYITNGRDLSEWVHIDVLFQAYFNACLIMMTPPDGSDVGGGLGVPFNAGNPYVGNPTQAGFGTFGPPAIKALLCEVASRAVKTTWHKKWQVHRRLRPENGAALVEVHVNRSPGRYNGALHSSLFSSSVLDLIESHNGGTLLLPMAHHEGCPTHPSYTAGHATVAGACITILKAVFDTENRPIENPVVPTPDGLALVPYTGPTLTVEGELNKCASNVATGRNISGVHWRSDAFESLRLGQKMAVSILRDYLRMHNEPNASFNFRGFDGERIIL